MISDSGYRVARQHAAAIDRSERGRIVVSGADRRSYLHGLLTNDVAALEPGQGCYAAYLTAQGRMIADLFVYELGDAILVTTPRPQHQMVIEKLDQFIFSEDVQLGDASDSFSTIAIVGPDAARLVGQWTGIGEADVAALPEHGNRRGLFEGSAVIVTRVTDTGEPGFDMHVEAAAVPALRRALEAANLPMLDRETAEMLRVEAGIPVFGRDMTEDTIPLEAGIESRAISFSKGCYVGQEVIIRVMHRGHGRVVRKLVGLSMQDGPAPASGVSISGDGRDIGLVTSSTFSAALQHPIALGYVHRDFQTPGTAVAIDGRPAVVTELPFVRADH